MNLLFKTDKIFLKSEILILEFLLCISYLVFLCNRISLVKVLLTFSKTNFHLHLSLFQIYLKRNKCVTFNCKFTSKLINLILVKKQLLRS